MVDKIMSNSTTMGKVFKMMEGRTDLSFNRDKFFRRFPLKSSSPSPSSPSPSAAGIAASKQQRKIYHSEDINEPSVTAEGKVLASSFQEMIVETPRDHRLKMSWNAMIDNEIAERILRVNLKLLQNELKKSGISYDSYLFSSTSTSSTITSSSGSEAVGLSELLRVQLLSREQIKEILVTAMKLQVGRLVTTSFYVSPSLSSEEEQKRKRKKESLFKKNVDGTMMIDDDGHFDNVDELFHSSSSSKAPLSTPSASSMSVLHSSSSLPASFSKHLSLSLWSLDTAISSILKISIPRYGKPLSKSKEEIANSLSLDKHERSLISNVISPQDIDITYDMIGGLEDVKEMLRQSITYPLKYPKLYSEGIANEAVKGVLLFGPPGMEVLSFIFSFLSFFLLFTLFLFAS
jgi:SpoVK/Ycf46/Vps4 family AAA+-type ATPase